MQRYKNFMTLAIKSLDLFELICDYPYINVLVKPIKVPFKGFECTFKGFECPFRGFECTFRGFEQTFQST